MATHHFLLRSDCWHCLQLPQSILLPQPAQALIPSYPYPIPSMNLCCCKGLSQDQDKPIRVRTKLPNPA